MAWARWRGLYRPDSVTGSFVAQLLEQLIRHQPRITAGLRIVFQKLDPATLREIIDIFSGGAERSRTKRPRDTHDGLTSEIPRADRKGHLLS